MEERYADPRRRGGRGGRCRDRRARKGRARARAWTRRGRTSSGRERPCADVLRERRGERESALRDGRATKARDRVSIDARATRVGKEMDGVRAGGRTPVDDPSAGDASRRRARAYLLSFARVRNVLEVVTRPRGSLATRSAMRAGRASRRGAPVALPESAGLPPIHMQMPKVSPTSTPGARD